MSNPSIDGKIKIGQSGSDPSSRKDELYTTAVPEPFKVEYSAFVEDYVSVEKRVHNKLSNFRPNNGREFFTCSVPEAILVIREVAEIKLEEVFFKSPEEIQLEKIKQKKLDEERKSQERLLERQRVYKEREQREVLRQKQIRESAEFSEKIDQLPKNILISVWENFFAPALVSVLLTSMMCAPAFLFIVFPFIGVIPAAVIYYFMYKNHKKIIKFVNELFGLKGTKQLNWFKKD